MSLVSEPLSLAGPAAKLKCITNSKCTSNRPVSPVLSMIGRGTCTESSRPANSSMVTLYPSMVVAWSAVVFSEPFPHNFGVGWPGPIAVRGGSIVEQLPSFECR